MISFMSYWTAIQNKIIFYKMNFYKFLSNFKGKQIPHVFPAINIRDDSAEILNT